MTRRFAAAAAPFVLYLGVSALVLGHLVLGDLGGTTIGTGPDPAAFVWIIKWWPQAVANGWNPLHTDVAYAPDGFNMTWVTSIPGPSLALAPVTQLAGPIVSYNLLVIATPALNGWSAFMLCRELRARYFAAVFGGYLFGFSSYVMGQVSGHPQTSLVAALPLASLLAVRYLERRMPSRLFVVAMSAVLTAQFLISVEMFLTLAIFGALALALAAVFFPRSRGRLLSFSKLTVAAYLVTAVIVSPYLYANLSESGTLSAIDPLPFSTDPLSVVIPTHLTKVGGALFESVSSRFTGGEQGAYIGVPLLLLLGLIAWKGRADGAVRFLLALIAVAFVASLGPRLNLLGHVTAIRLPWTPFIHLPITEYILPARLIVYAWLPFTVLLSLGLSSGGNRVRWALAIAGALLLLPATGATDATYGGSFWRSPRHVPAFFRDTGLRQMLPRQGTVLVLPYAVADQGESMVWQAEADMGFAMPDGYLSAVVPPSFACWPVEAALRSAAYESAGQGEFLSFLASKEVRAVVVSAAERRAAEPLLSALPGKPRRSGGVYVYRVPASSVPSHVAACPSDI